MYLCDYHGRCGNNYGWSRFEGSRCQEAAEDRLGPCDGVDRSGFTFPIFEYCHPDYDSSVASEDAFTDGVDICAATTLRGNAVIGNSGRATSSKLTSKHICSWYIVEARLCGCILYLGPYKTGFRDHSGQPAFESVCAIASLLRHQTSLCSTVWLLVVPLSTVS